VVNLVIKIRQIPYKIIPATILFLRPSKSTSAPNIISNGRTAKVAYNPSLPAILPDSF